MFKVNPRDMKKMMKRMGIDVDIEEVQDAERVFIERSSGTRIVIENPQITIMKMKGQSVLQIIGDIREEKLEKRDEKIEEIEIKEEDVELVALEAGVSLEEARQALIFTKGDLAQAILMLQSKKK